MFIIEDLHCSYHQQHRGGIFYPISSINFFKKLVDIINYEHWGIEKKKDWLLRGFSENYKINIEDLMLDNIHSIEFVNSLCFIKKKSPKDLLNYGYISLQYLDNPYVYVTTPPMVCVFGVDKNASPDTM